MNKLLLAAVLSALSACCLAWRPEQSRADGVPLRELGINLADFDCLHSDNFQIYLEPSSSLDATTVELLETVYDRYCGLMRKEGYVLGNTTPFTWLCFTDRHRYLAYSQAADHFTADRLNSYYSATTNCVAMLTGAAGSSDDLSAGSTRNPHEISASDFPTAGTIVRGSGYRAMMTHELIHQLAFNTGLQKRGIEYPLWLSEGMATAFEYLFHASDVPCDNQHRLQTILRMYRGGGLIPLEFFVSMSRLSWPGLTDSETYAQCWGFFDFLWQTKPAQLKRYFLITAERKTGPTRPADLKAEFIDCFGRVEDLESEWNAWLLARTANLH